MTKPLPSQAQMMQRANDGHLKVLRMYVMGKPPEGLQTAPMSTLFGLRTCLKTLARWGCIENNTITERGAILFATLAAKEHAWKRSGSP